MSLTSGDRVPRFSLPTDGGGTLSLGDIDEAAVIYFYPKDDTSGCSKEAQAFRDAADEFSAAGTRVIGVSPDSVASHEKFKTKHGLNFTLVADVGKTLAEAFGVWVEKRMYGKKYMGIERSTFLVDANGVIRKAWRKVKVPGHVADVLRAAREIGQRA